MFVASGQGLMAVIRPSTNADNIGMLLFSNSVCKNPIYKSLSWLAIVCFSAEENAFWSLPFIKAKLVKSI